jgi:hypothetical protein
MQSVRALQDQVNLSPEAIMTSQNATTRRAVDREHVVDEFKITNEMHQEADSWVRCLWECVFFGLLIEFLFATGAAKVKRFFTKL